MNRVPMASREDVCPCLASVGSDQLWMVRTPLYCRRPDGRVRAPARTTLDTVCLTPSFRTCAGYRTAAETLH